MPPLGEPNIVVHGDRYDIIMYHHTHWDREWWAPLQAFRTRLAHVIDELLDTLDRDPSFCSFLLDGQTIMLKDYLEIRPENRERLVHYIRAGRIGYGPWYILPDEFLVSGEAHIRNLWLGERVARELGYRNMDLGYVPDTFGHISQLPQLLRLFGIDNAFVWRGRGGDPDTVKQEFWWAAPDGSTVLAHWFPETYYVMHLRHFPNPARGYDDTFGRLRRALEEYYIPRATTNLLLLPYGGDHHGVDPALPATLRRVNEGIADIGEMRWGTPKEYLAAVRARAPRLDTVGGELRGAGTKHAHLLQGVLSARLYLKRLNAEGQRLLERYAEPFAAVAWRYGAPYDAALLWKAWEFLVQNHPHDSICGCSVDQVHREMIPRFDQSRQIAEIVTEESARYVDERIDTSGGAGAERVLVVRNPLPWPRTDWAAVLVDHSAVSPRIHQLVDADGRDVPFQTREVEGLRPLRDRWRWTEIGFAAADVPGLGYCAYYLRRRAEPLDPRDVDFSAVQPVARRKGSAAVTDLRLGANVLENAHLRVEVNPADGTLTVLDKGTGERYDGLNLFEDGGDAGDSYNYAAPLNDHVLRSSRGARVSVTVTTAGYARATLRVDVDWELPVGLSADRLSRLSQYRTVRISSFVTLGADTRRVEVVTEWDNTVEDHRLRAIFPLGAPARVSHAEGQFDVVTRPVAVSDAGNGWAEPFIPTLPQQGWISVNTDDGTGAGRGLTVANVGLPEAEALDDGRGTIALTLVRAVGWVSRDDTLARVGGAGPEVPVPDAQCPGLNRVSYAIVPHRGDWLAARSYATAHEYLSPFYGSETGVHAGGLPPDGAFIALDGDHTLLLSACKKAEHTDALILRFWNVAKRETAARVRLRERPIAARLVDLKEEPLESDDAALAISPTGAFTLRAGPARIVTVMVEFPPSPFEGEGGGGEG